MYHYLSSLYHSLKEMVASIYYPVKSALAVPYFFIKDIFAAPLQRLSEDYLILYIALPAAIALLVFEIIRHIDKPDHVNNWLLTLVSSLLIIMISPTSFIVLSILSIAVYIITRLELDYRAHLLTLTLFIITALIGIKFIANNFSSHPLFLIGLSYYFFRLGSVLVEHGRGNEDYKNMPAHRFFAYVFFFPLFLSGPIQRFHDFKREDISSPQVPRFYTYLIILFFAKFALVDYTLFGVLLEPMRTSLFPIMGEWSALPRFGFTLVHGFISFLYGYLDLMIYTEMAITAGRLLGYHVVENFNRPLLATNIAEFWRRWHISLSGWARDYVYFPIMLRWRSTWIATYATMLAIGLWHTANLNWIVWAVGHGTAINLYNLWRQTNLFKTLRSFSDKGRVLAISGNILTIAFVSLIYNLVAFPHHYDLPWQLFAKTIGY